MNINNLIISTLAPLALPVVQDIYEGKSDKWITFNYMDDRGANYANDEPQCEVASLQIHLFTPKDFNYFELKKQIRSRLFEVGFSYAQVSTFYEEDSKFRHTVFECEYEQEREEKSWQL